ncbi:MAG: AtpZ/AtpI family protein [Candidatus Nomurabacteria bacterium]|nr:AtpZ/AtpI family protein [Candidatus Nomurabacteria bacterium]
MNNQENPSLINPPWWKDGVIIFTKVSAYIVFPIIISSYFGNYLDNKYNKNNLFFFGLTAIAFLITIYLIWKEARIYKKKLDIKEKREN